MLNASRLLFRREDCQGEEGGNQPHGLLEPSPCFLPFLRDQLADVMGIPVGKPGQRKLGYTLRTLRGETFARCHPRGVAGWAVCCEMGSGAWLEGSRAWASGDGCLPRASRMERVIEIACPETAEGFGNA